MIYYHKISAFQTKLKDKSTLFINYLYPIKITFSFFSISSLVGITNSILIKIDFCFRKLCCFIFWCQGHSDWKWCFGVVKIPTEVKTLWYLSLRISCQRAIFTDNSMTRYEYGDGIDTICWSYCSYCFFIVDIFC